MSSDDEVSGNIGRRFISEARKSPDWKREMEEGIAKFGENPIPKILNLISSNPEDRDNRYLCGMLLAYMGERSIPFLLEQLGNPNFPIATFAAKTLADIEGTESYLIEAAKNPSSNIRYHAIGAMQSFKADGEGLIPILKEVLKTESEQKIIGVAADALGKIGPKAIPAIQELLRHHNPMVRIYALVALRELGKPAIPILRKVETDENDPKVLNGIRKILGELL